MLAPGPALSIARSPPRQRLPPAVSPIAWSSLVSIWRLSPPLVFSLRMVASVLISSRSWPSSSVRASSRAAAATKCSCSSSARAPPTFKIVASRAGTHVLPRRCSLHTVVHSSSCLRCSPPMLLCRSNRTPIANRRIISTLCPNLAALTPYNATVKVDGKAPAVMAARVEDVKAYSNLCGIFAIRDATEVEQWRAACVAASKKASPEFN
jgi:hypothetical protein